MSFKTPNVASDASMLSVALGNLWLIPKALLAFAACLSIVLFKWGRGLVTFESSHDVPWARWLALHFVLFAAFCYQTAFLFGHSSDAANLSLTQVGLWLLSGGLTGLPLFLIVAPLDFWSSILRKYSGEVLLSGGVAVFMLVGSWWARSLWFPLADMTLQSVKHLLSLFYPLAEQNSGTVVGTEYFVVDVAPECSGIEGVGLIVMFLALYGWIFRKQLSFPRVLWLLPLGIAAIWGVNVFRIVALIAIGSSVSREIALGGFHSQAGWIGFCGVSLALIVVAHRMFGRELTGCRDASADRGIDSRASALVVPLLVSLAASILVDAISGNFRLWYPVIAVLTLASLAVFRRHYATVLRRPDLPTIAIGVAVFLAWLVLVSPDPDQGERLVAGLNTLPDYQQFAWIAFRFIGSVVAVPIAEELAFRGYILPRLAGRTFDKPSYTTTPWGALAVSSALFGLMHSHWVAGFVAGTGFSAALLRRNRLSDAVWAHTISNGLIAMAVLAARRWDLWA